MMTTVMRDFTDRKDLVGYLVLQIAELLSAGVADNGRASFAVSGGSTPVELFERLSLLDISWKDISITLVDERWVEPSDDDSNERLARTHLLQNKAAAATFVGMKNGAEVASDGEAECEQNFKKIPQPFDVLILGMGGDGHTASLFPGAKKLAAATAMDSGRTCMALAPLTAPHERMSLTLPVILASRQIFLHIVGQEKREVLDKAMTDGPVEEMPIRFVLKQESTPVSVYWAP
jgi:6-phosphogluconolactonase